VQCHGAPGVERAGWAKGMHPAPPDLARTADRWTAAELHWIVPNGVKMTSMPAVGAHHSAADIWNIVAFVQTLPRTTPEAYRRARLNAGAGGSGVPSRGAPDHSH
jgi:mono/diheme cytochrome c family protein